jgi:hypothetical protein
MIRHTHRRIAAAAALVATALVAPGLAQADDGVTAKVSGFGTFGMVNSSANTSQYRTGQTQYRGAGADPEFGVDSRAGVQADVQFNDMFSATGQLLTIRRGVDDFKPGVEWLFGQAKLPYGFNLRVGRMGIPAYLVSDFRNVGYATPWIRPPSEVYAGMMYATFDGTQIVYRKSLGNFNITIQPSYGKTKSEVKAVVPITGLGNLTTDVRLDADTFYGINGLVEYGDWTGRWGTVRSNALADVYGTIPGLGRIKLGSGTSFKDNFSGFGLQYDNGKLLVMAEYVTRRSIQRNQDSYYISTAYRFGNLAPYVTFAGFRENTVPVNESSSQTVGLRWNVAKNTSLKAQYDFVEPNNVVFISAPAGTARVLSLAVDFVF